jgi:hypothetical protein
MLASTKIQIGIAAGSAAAAGVLGFVAVPWGGGDGPPAPVDLAGKGGIVLRTSEQTTSSSSLGVTTGELTTRAHVPERRADPARTAARSAPSSEAKSAPATKPGGGARVAQPMMTESYDESAPIVYRETTVEWHITSYDGYDVVYETTAVTEVNSLDQTRTTTETNRYTQEASPNGLQSEARTADSTTSPAAPNGS